MRKWGKISNRNQPQGQIAVFLVFLIALVFILITVSTNISKISSMKTAVSNTADSTALYYASQVGSYAWALWYKLLVQMDQRDKMNQKDGAGNYYYDFCYMNWSVFGTFLALIALIVLTILTYGATSEWLPNAIGAWLASIGITATMLTAAAVFTALEIATDIAKEGRTLGAMTRALSKLPPEGQIQEVTARFAFSRLVDDPKKVLDTHDLNEDGKTNDYVYRFNLLNTMRLNELAGRDDLILGLADLIGSFCLAADNFRQYCGGTQVFPELGYDQAVWDDWQTKLPALGYNVPPNNSCYYQGGDLIQLMADFRAEWLKCEVGTGEKPFMNIDNVDLRDLTPGVNNFVQDSLPEYEEEFIYYFPFWSGNVSEPSNPNRNPDNIDNPEPPPGAPTSTWGPDPFDEFACKDLGGKGNNPGRATSIDEVDQIILQLEKYRSWARGSFGYRYEEPPEPPPGDPPLPLIQHLEFLYGIGRRGEWPGTWPDKIYGISDQLTNTDIQRTFTGWYRQMYDVDHEGEEQEKMTWYRQIEYFLNKTGSDTNKGCGWFREFRAVLEEKQFINLAESDVVGLYAGLDTILPPLGVTPSCDGKRKELKDKMKRVCDKLTALIAAYNALPRCPPFAWHISTIPSGFCTKGNVLVSPPLSVNPPCSNCFEETCSPRLVNTSCVANFIQQITSVITIITAARKTLEDEWTACNTCCTNELNKCNKKCDDTYDLCIANADATPCCILASGPAPDCSGCNSSCPDCSPACPLCIPPRPEDCSAHDQCESDYDDCMQPCKDYAQCQSDCAWYKTVCANLRKMCKDNCTTIYNACTQTCHDTFHPPIECRDAELAKLEVILYYAQKFQTLANALAYVEGLIQRVERAPAEINAFKNSATPLLAYVKANEVDLANRTVYLRSGGSPPVNEQGATLAAAKDGLDTVFTYQWPTLVNNRPIQHKVTVRLGPCKLATARAKRCRWVFGRGGELIDHTSFSNDPSNPKAPPDLTVTIRREDQASNLILRFFQWLFQANVTTARAKAAYSPRADDPKGGIRLIEVH